jgi:hypothetical protein
VGLVIGTICPDVAGDCPKRTSSLQKQSRGVKLFFFSFPIDLFDKLLGLMMCYSPGKWLSHAGDFSYFRLRGA